MTQFLKMHGLGNDFVVFDARRSPVSIDARRACAIANRKRGIGADQIIVIEPAGSDADAIMRILNADGSEVETCGNATRCVVRLLTEESGKSEVRIATKGGLRTGWALGDGRYAVDMGPGETAWDKIPLARAVDTNRFTLSVDGRTLEPAAVSMGNPHCVLFVDDAETVDVAGLGARLETDAMFPNRTNVEFVSLLGKDRLRMRVWERGVGITEACGSGACASAFSAWRRGLTGAKVDVELDGGTLEIAVDNGRIRMTGPAALAFAGEIDWKDLA